MAFGQWLCTRLIFGACFGMNHNAFEGLKEFGEEMSSWETNLEDYIPRDRALRPQVPALILRHAHIQWSNWIAAQWSKTSKVFFSNLTGLWTAMIN